MKSPVLALTLALLAAPAAAEAPARFLAAGALTEATQAERATEGGATFSLKVDLGLVADGHSAADAQIAAGSNTLTAPSRPCQPFDATKIVVVAGAGVSTTTVSGGPYALTNGASAAIAVAATSIPFFQPGGWVYDVTTSTIVGTVSAVSPGSITVTGYVSPSVSPSQSGTVVINGGDTLQFNFPLHSTVTACSGPAYVLADRASTSVAKNTNAASWAIGTDNSPKLATALATLGRGSGAGNNVRLIAPAGQMLFDAGVTVPLKTVSIEGPNIPQFRSAPLGAAANGGSVFLITGATQSPFTLYQGIGISGVTVFYPGQAGATPAPVVYPPLFVDNGTEGTGDWTFDKSNCINCYDFFTQRSAAHPLGGIRITESNIYAVRRAFTLQNVGEQVYTADDIFNSSVYFKVVAAGDRHLQRWSAQNGVFAYVTGDGTPTTCMDKVAEINVGPGTVIAGANRVFEIQGGHLDESQFATGADANAVGQLVYVAPSGVVTDTIWQGIGIANGSAGVTPSGYAFDFQGTCGNPVGNYTITGKLGSLKGGGVRVGGANLRHVEIRPSDAHGFAFNFVDVDNPNAVVDVTGRAYGFNNKKPINGIRIARSAAVNVSGLTLDTTNIAFDLRDYRSGLVNIAGNLTLNTGAASFVGPTSPRIRVTGNAFDLSGGPAAESGPVRGVFAAPGGGAPPKISGNCTAGGATGGEWAGSFETVVGCRSGTTIVLTFAAPAAHGYACDAHNENSPATSFNQTAHTPTTATLTLADVSRPADVVVWKCQGF